MKNSEGIVKDCRKCLRLLPITQFRFTNKEQNKRHPICRECRNIHRQVTRKGHSEFDALLSEQGGCCAICGIHYLDEKNKFRVDHNHETLQIRGLLCQHCNSGLGFFRDSPTRLAMAIEYLVKNDGITS